MGRSDAISPVESHMRSPIAGGTVKKGNRGIETEKKKKNKSGMEERKDRGSATRSSICSTI